jgi:pilus assembly protein CpaB
VTQSQNGQTASRVVLGDVKVLAIGTRLGQTGATGAPKDATDPQSQVFTSSVIATLELTPPQANTLINATATGKISLVLRSVADFGKTASTASGSGSDDQTVKIIRFGREASVTAGSGDQGQATVAPVSYTAPAQPITAVPAVAVQPGTTTTNGDGSVTVSGPTTTTVTTSTPPGATPVPVN